MTNCIYEIIFHYMKWSDNTKDTKPQKQPNYTTLIKILLLTF